MSFKKETKAKCSNTARNSKGKRIIGKPFVAGDDRINRHGRPRSFDALRELAQAIAQEQALTDEGKPLLRKSTGKPLTTVEMVMRSWATSPDGKKQRAFIEYAYGKVPQGLEHTSPDGSMATDPKKKLSAKELRAEIERRGLSHIFNK